MTATTRLFASLQDRVNTPARARVATVVMVKLRARKSTCVCRRMVAVTRIKRNAPRLGLGSVSAAVTPDGRLCPVQRAKRAWRASLGHGKRATLTARAPSVRRVNLRLLPMPHQLQHALRARLARTPARKVLRDAQPARIPALARQVLIAATVFLVPGWMV